VKSELATFFDAFPYATIWANTRDGQGYDMVFMASLEPMKIDLDAVQERYERADYMPAAQSLREIGIFSPVDFFSTYAGQKSDFEIWLKDSEINRDRDLRLQYLAGWGINSSLEDYIYRQIIGYRRAPQNLFTGSPQRVQSLLVGLGR
jgi:spermidine synthase